MAGGVAAPPVPPGGEHRELRKAGNHGARTAGTAQPVRGQQAAELGVRTATLLGQEFALAKAELRAAARTGATLLGTAAALGLSAWMVLLLAVAAGLAVVLPVWAAALTGEGSRHRACLPGAAAGARDAGRQFGITGPAAGAPTR